MVQRYGKNCKDIARITPECTAPHSPRRGGCVPERMYAGSFIFIPASVWLCFPFCQNYREAQREILVCISILQDVHSGPGLSSFLVHISTSVGCESLVLAGTWWAGVWKCIINRERVSLGTEALESDTSESRSLLHNVGDLDNHMASRSLVSLLRNVEEPIKASKAAFSYCK